MSGGTGVAIARAARTCVDASFRPQGRVPSQGLDCLGVVAIAYGGHLNALLPKGYCQRGGSEAAIAATIDAAGFRRIVPGEATEGDLLLLSTGPGQWHFAVRTDSGFVHADARLGRVVEVPGLPPWPMTGAWRIAGES